MVSNCTDGWRIQKVVSVWSLLTGLNDCFGDVSRHVAKHVPQVRTDAALAKSGKRMTGKRPKADIHPSLAMLQSQPALPTFAAPAKSTILKHSINVLKPLPFSSLLRYRRVKVCNVDLAGSPYDCSKDQL